MLGVGTQNSSPLRTDSWPQVMLMAEKGSRGAEKKDGSCWGGGFGTQDAEFDVAKYPGGG